MEPTSQPFAKEENHLGEKLFPVLQICQKMNSERDLAAPWVELRGKPLS